MRDTLLLFDIEGTLVNSEAIILAAMAEVIAEDFDHLSALIAQFSR